MCVYTCYYLMQRMILAILWLKKKENMIMSMEQSLPTGSGDNQGVLASTLYLYFEDFCPRTSVLHVVLGYPTARARVRAVDGQILPPATRIFYTYQYQPSQITVYYRY